ncbi:N-acetylmuramoyl-L-alanine amidase [Sinisalibacter aestuarii]|uniref:N-acetylmuramoyl-L-alanine amidase n=1 Tax=Sinisalibacter aestuarii TaxID=2949426 RepID=A0ABQ5LSB5_9RHOB|nr:N-acetylmuramoyl-L-alanine amidase [Sinisalibacter aestuarii]GKY87882.1 N-acetylmuramoyl-L-alanine amidase [Sinisalibacter aestuarii]
MRRILTVFLLGLTLLAALPAAAQQELTGLARLTGAGAALVERNGRLELSLEMSQSVPWRVFTLDGPPRVVLDLSELDWTGADPDALAAGLSRVAALSAGTFRPGWSRMVIELGGPMRVAEAGMTTDATGARLDLRLEDSDAESFAAAAGAPESALFRLTDGAALPARPRQRGAGPLTVVIDPGHGGIDPGAERDGVRESDLMLTFARELKEVLLRAGNIDVVLTRDDDIFVPLETRVTIARRAGADVFLSFHADALAEGRAHGATVYTLATDASDEASEKLAERHDRADLLAGVDLSDTDDEVALVLMDLARTETAPRSNALADALVEGIYSATQSTYKTPRHQAAFSVLKAPDIPSALVELGFLSSERDREKLTDPDWRRQAALGIRDALLYWSIEDAALADRLRR